MKRNKIIQNPIIKKPLLFLYQSFWLFLAKNLSDRTYLKFKYFYFFHKRLNLDNPTLFTEKLQWLKINDRKPIYHRMVDKLEVKKFIEERVGKEYNIPTLGVWDRFEDIDFDKLPNEFILKCTHDSGSYYICRDKSKIDLGVAKKRLYQNFKYDYYIWSREWPYKGIKPKIIAEPLLHDNENLCPIDYKFYTFNGEPKFLCIITDKGKKSGNRIDFFDATGELMKIEQIGYPNNINTPKLPSNFEKMMDMSKILSDETRFLRVDFYEINKIIYVGEMTFYENGGFCAFNPDEYDKIFGDWIKLPID